jgi:hypothetical protein
MQSISSIIGICIAFVTLKFHQILAFPELGSGDRGLPQILIDKVSS